ncbi:MAG: hypothetical protein ACR2KQ_12050 [Actinomycetota bacterium]
MTLVFFVVLALAWAAVFVPAAIRARQGTPYSSAERFKRGMDRIAPGFGSSGRWVVVPRVPGESRRRRSFARAQARRIRLLKALIGLVGVTLLLGVAVGGTMWKLHLVCLFALATYVAALVGAKRRRTETRTKIRPLQARRPQQEEVVFYEPAQATGGGR